jgi:hypothetical protein
MRGFLHPLIDGEGHLSRLVSSAGSQTTSWPADNANSLCADAVSGRFCSINRPVWTPRAGAGWALIEP